MKNAILKIIVLAVGLWGVMPHSIIAQAPDYTFYFSDCMVDAPVCQLFKASPVGLSPIFKDNNQGFMPIVSPDKGWLLWTRSDWENTTLYPKVSLWLGDLSTNVQVALTPENHFEGISGVWSPDSQFALVSAREAIPPLSAGYPYALYFLLDPAQVKLEQVEVEGLFIGWYPDSESALFWHETQGYFRYYFEQGEPVKIAFEGVTGWRSPTWASQASLMASIVEDGSIQINSGETGDLTTEIPITSLNQAGISYANVFNFSSDGNYLLIDAGSNGEFVIWSLETNQWVDLVKIPEAQAGVIGYVWDAQTETLFFYDLRGDWVYSYHLGNLQLDTIYRDGKIIIPSNHNR